jgi:glucose-6-phosphate 1-dehydrogenase
MERLLGSTRRLQALFVFAAAVGAFVAATGESIPTLPASEISDSTYLRVIVVGATGDLAAKYLWVACFRLALEMRLSYGQRVLFTAAARDTQEEGDRWISQFFTSAWAARVCGQEESVGSSMCRVFYTREFVPAIQYATLATREQYEALSGALRRQDSQLREEGLTEAGRLVYLAIPPQAFLQVALISLLATLNHRAS